MSDLSVPTSQVPELMAILLKAIFQKTAIKNIITSILISFFHGILHEKHIFWNSHLGCCILTTKRQTKHIKY